MVAERPPALSPGLLGGDDVQDGGGGGGGGGALIAGVILGVGIVGFLCVPFVLISSRMGIKLFSLTLSLSLYP
jgi:hypothetical protein